jgi:hypothetical protein
MLNQRDVRSTTLYHRAIRNKIGEGLSAGYDLSQPLPERLSTLLGQLDKAKPAPPHNNHCSDHGILKIDVVSPVPLASAAALIKLKGGTS